MKKGQIVLLILCSFFLIVPTKTKALNFNNDATSLTNFYSEIKYKPFLLVKSDDTSLDDMEEWMDGYNQEQDCSSDNSLLGNPNDPDSVAWLLQQILNYTRVIGPILVVILSSIEFAKIIIQSDDEAMGKAQKKLINRLILVVALFFVPTLVQALLQIFGITSDPTCGLK